MADCVQELIYEMRSSEIYDTVRISLPNSLICTRCLISLGVLSPAFAAWDDDLREAASGFSLAPQPYDEFTKNTLRHLARSFPAYRAFVDSLAPDTGRFRSRALLSGSEVRQGSRGAPLRVSEGARDRRGSAAHSAPLARAKTARLCEAVPGMQRRDVPEAAHVRCGRCPANRWAPCGRFAPLRRLRVALSDASAQRPARPGAPRCCVQRVCAQSCGNADLGAISQQIGAMLGQLSGSEIERNGDIGEQTVPVQEQIATLRAALAGCIAETDSFGFDIMRKEVNFEGMHE